MKNIDIQILDSPLSIDQCYTFVMDEKCGGICLFIGAVRNFNKGKEVTKLDFEAYSPMAIKELDKIARLCIEKFEVKKVSIHHRIGEVNIIEKAVIIAVSTPHRKKAFLACEFLIDELKKTVPIWKKEFLINGSYWVSPTP